MFYLSVSLHAAACASPFNLFAGWPFAGHRRHSYAARCPSR